MAVSDPSIVNINNIPRATIFNFTQAETHSVKKMIHDLDSTKSGTLRFPQYNSTLANYYRPISLLLTISIVFKRIMFNQITTCINEYLSFYFCGFRKGFNTQTALSPHIASRCFVVEKTIKK